MFFEDLFRDGSVFGGVVKGESRPGRKVDNAANTSHAAAADTDASPTTSQYQAKKRIQQLDAAVRNNWHRDAFCSTHGWGVNENHTSANCRSQKPGHIATATCASAAGPGKTLNKGWDDFLSRRSSDRT